MTIERAEPSFTAGDREMLDGWLDYHRATLLTKCEGLSDEQLKTRAVPPSSMSRLGLVRHMSEVELGWFANGLEADETATPICCSEASPDGDFDDLDSAPSPTSSPASTRRGPGPGASPPPATSTRPPAAPATASPSRCVGSSPT